MNNKKNSTKNSAKLKNKQLQRQSLSDQINFILRSIMYVPYVYVWAIKWLFNYIKSKSLIVKSNIKTYKSALMSKYRVSSNTNKQKEKKPKETKKINTKPHKEYTISYALNTLLSKFRQITKDYWVRFKENEIKFHTSINIKTSKTTNKLYPSVKNITKQVISLPIKLIKGIWLIITFPFRVVYRFFKKLFSWRITVKVFSFRTLLFIIFAILFYFGSILYLQVLKDIPSPDRLNNYSPRLTSNIYDRKGNLLYRLYDEQDRSLVSLDNIPTDLINATIAIEDQEFYDHNGISPRGIIRAAKKTLTEEKLEGGSTITQQLVKTTILSPERTIERKIKEAILAMEIERRYTKNQILELYLNTISYGGTSYGVKSAAKKYFNKELSELTLAESAYIAGLPASPSNYSPFSSNPQIGEQRKNLVLIRMHQDGYINQQELDNAISQKLEFNISKEKIVAPHFVNYVLNYLEKKYPRQILERGGLEIYTTIDLDLQAKAQDIVKTNVDGLKRNNVKNGSVLITNPQTGEILAMVGSIDFWDKTNDGEVNITTALRQPGSSIKPVTYSLAFERGLTPDDFIIDEPVTYQIPGQKPYKPVNYDGKFHGKMTLRSALANSYNIPAVKLMESIGKDSLIQHAQNLGIQSWNQPDRYGLSLTLGAGEVSMTDMAVVYGVFANGGYKKELDPIVKIYNAYGEVFEDNDCLSMNNSNPTPYTQKMNFFSKVIASDSLNNEKNNDQNGISCTKDRVLSEKTAYYISSILSDNKARLPAFGSNNELAIKNKQVAVKTGTTQNLRDNWAIGYNNDFVVVSWVGNNDNTIMKNVTSGYNGSSTIWKQVWEELVNEELVVDKIKLPSNLVEVEICPLTKTLACEGCPNTLKIYEKGTEPTIKCDPKEVQSIIEKNRQIEEQKRKEMEERENRDKDNDD